MVLILLGPPGSGKGTQADLLAKAKDMVQISTGEILRSEVKAGTAIGQKVEAIMNEGKFPEDGLIMDILSGKLASLRGAGVILDGVPRTVNQAELLDEMLHRDGGDVGKVIELRVDPEILIKRLSGRFSCAKCGEIYNEYYKPTGVDGLCDKCGSSEMVRRKDDNKDSVETRLRVYREQTEPLLDYYKSQGKLASVDAMNDVKEVSNQINLILSETGS